MPAEEERFLQGINRKNDGTWKELYRCFYGALCSYADNILQDRQVAEDVVQETLIKVWNSTLEFAEAKSLSAYLYHSVRNNALKYLRDKDVDTRRLDHWQQELTKEKEGEDGTAFLYPAVEEEMVRKLRMAIDRLPAQSREIILKSLEGHTVQQIADLLAVSSNTVKTQKKRAYSSLKKELGPHFHLMYLLFFV